VRPIVEMCSLAVFWRVVALEPDRLIGGPSARFLTDGCSYPAANTGEPVLRSIDPIGDSFPRLHCPDLLDLRLTASVGPLMREIESLVETYLIAERDLVAAVDAAGGAVPLPDGRTVSVGRAEFDALLGERRKRAWVIIRQQAPMPARR
jgi:hypothetical protein